MGEDHRPGPGPLPSSLRAARTPELWVVIEVPEPVRSEVLAVRRIVSRTSQKVPVGIGSVGPLPAQDVLEVRRVLDAVGEETGPIIGRFVGLRRFPQTRYVYLAPDDEMATSLLILQDRLVEYGLKLAPDVYQATPHAVIGRVPPEAELEVAAGARPLVPSPTFRMTTLALWSLTEHDASCLHRVALTGVL
ncbi:MAG TPA: 2'-5' RNA ligase family protein [Myxococcaceae bacterium]|nr:2'-5' RNA ligase family protein [Myxococcaceae bacterium]